MPRRDRPSSPSSVQTGAQLRRQPRHFARTSIIFSAMLLLGGCFDSAPSDSGLQKITTSLIGDCSLATIENFKKINGYPQPDGSYLDDISFTMVLHPSQANVRYLSELHTQTAALDQENAADLAADATSATEMKRRFAQCDEVYGREVGALEEQVHLNLSSIADVAHEDQNYDAFNSEERWHNLSPAFGQKYGGMIAANKSCKAGVVSEVNDQERINRIHARWANKEVVAKKYNALLDQEFIKQCPMRNTILSFGVWIARRIDHKTENYGKLFQQEFSFRLHLVKSDRGWVVSSQ